MIFITLQRYVHEATAFAAAMIIVLLAVRLVGAPALPTPSLHSAARAADREALQAPRFESALLAKASGAREAAFAAFAALADEGHCEAARHAWAMLAHQGQGAHPPGAATLRAGPKQVGRWQRIPHCEWRTIPLQPPLGD